MLERWCVLECDAGIDICDDESGDLASEPKDDAFRVSISAASLHEATVEDKSSPLDEVVALARSFRLGKVSSRLCCSRCRPFLCTRVKYSSYFSAEQSSSLRSAMTPGRERLCSSAPQLQDFRKSTLLPPPPAAASLYP